MRLIDYQTFNPGTITNQLRAEPLRKEIIMIFMNTNIRDIRKIELINLTGTILLSITEKEIDFLGRPHIKICKTSNDIVKIRFIDCAQITKNLMYKIDIIKSDFKGESLKREFYLYDILER